MRLFSVLFLAAALPGRAEAQLIDPTGKLHAQLREQIVRVADAQKLPVYFVIRERFPFDEWYPRLLRLDVETRREAAVRELEGHAQRTQRELLAFLRAAARSGRVSDLASNWLGNFVSCKATAGVILEAATLPSVSQVWDDSMPPRSDVEDAAPAPVAYFAGSGDGPRTVGADQVWALGFKGQGVIVMNADSGISMSGRTYITHSDLRDRVWSNPGETFNGRDDDGNGKVDDVYGWDFSSNNNGLHDSGGHGTNTAGCMVADGTCSGTVYGIAPEARLMTGQIGSERAQWDAVQYAIKEGAHCQTSSHSYKIYYKAVPNYGMHRDVANSSLLAGLIRTNSTSNDGNSCASSTSSSRPPFTVSAPGCVPAPYSDPNQRLVGGRSGVIGVGAFVASSGAMYSRSPCGPFAWNLVELQARLAQMSRTYSHSWKSAYDDPTTLGRMGLLKPDVLAPTLTTTTAGQASCGTKTFSGTSNATPNAMGCILLWKSANMSLKPEDVAMIVHQTSDDAGIVSGKENDWGAGRIDALAGVRRALAVHRVNGDPNWTVTHKAGNKLTFELDGSENKLALIYLGGSRQSLDLGFVTFGLGQPILLLAAGATGTQGEISITVPVPTSAAGITLYSQAFLDDTSGPTGMWLASNVIGTMIVP